jgi:hypothetical protein
VLALFMACPAGGQQYIPWYVDVTGRTIPATIGMDLREQIAVSGKRSVSAVEAQGVLFGYGSVRYSYWPQVQLNDTFLPSGTVIIGGQEFGKNTTRQSTDQKRLDITFAIWRHTFECELDCGYPVRPLLVMDYVQADLRATGENTDRKQIEATESWGRILPAAGVTLFYSTIHVATEIRAAYGPDLTVFDGAIRYRPANAGRFVFGLGWFHRWCRIGDMRVRTSGPIIELTTSF